MDCVISPGLPYTGEIPKGLFVGKAIILNGSIPSNSYRFSVDLMCKNNTDVALHVSIRFDQKTIVRNSFLNNNWLEEERNPPIFPVAAGRKFELIILTEETHFKIAVNGHHVAEYKHRFPFHAVKSLYIKGEVQISRISYHSMRVPKFGQLGYPTATVPQNNQDGPVSQLGLSQFPPIYNPSLPFTQKFQEGLQPMVISISGRPTNSAHRFSINFLANADVALHLNVRFDQKRVVKNSRMNNTWGVEEYGAMVFKPGVNFDLVITINNQGFQLVANGQFYGIFQHRLMPISRVSSMEIVDDLILSSIQFI